TPRLPGMAAGRIEPLWDLERGKLHLRGGGDPDRLGDPAFLDETADDRALAPIDPGLDPRVVADRHVAGLNGSDGAVRVLPDEDRAVVDVHAHHPPRIAHHPVRDEVAHDADDARVGSPDPPVSDVDDR